MSKTLCIVMILLCVSTAFSAEQKETVPVVQKAQSPAQQQSAQKTSDAAKPQDRLMKFSTIIIDPGHGGYDYGIYVKDIKEKELNLVIAKDLAAMLQKKNLKVFLTRKVDQTSLLGERINLSSSKAPELFLSIHATTSDKFVLTTAAADESTTDAEIRPYKLSARQNRHLDKSRAAAKAIASALKAEFKTETILREISLPILTSVDAAAVLLEYPLTAQKTYDQKERDRLINALVKELAGHE